MKSFRFFQSELEWTAGIGITKMPEPFVPNFFIEIDSTLNQNEL